MDVDARNVIASEDVCKARGTETIHVYHQKFPEMRIGNRSAGEAAERLAKRLKSSLDVVVDPLHREPVGQAIADVWAFVNRTGTMNPARDR